MKLGGAFFSGYRLQGLGCILNAPGAGGCEWFVRLTPEPEFIQRAIDLGVPRSRICAMQGRFRRLSMRPCGGIGR